MPSPVFNHFGQLKSTDKLGLFKAACKHCSVEVTVKGTTTSNFITHLKMNKAGRLGTNKSRLHTIVKCEACQLFFASNPLKILRASGQYMYDENGQEYLDCINNVCHVGHCHPDVVEAGYQQMKTLNTNSRFLHDNMILLAQRITQTMPEKLSVVYLCNSGAYHGHVMSIIDISPYKLKVQTDGIHTCPPQVYIAPCPDTYRGTYMDCDYPGEDLAEKYANEVKDIIKVIHGKGRNVCCFIAESMQSCGGQIIYPPGYLRKVYQYVHDAGGVCIADEVQVGFGRAGTHFWAFQTQDVYPDIVTMGKPIGNGHPISAVVTTKEISAAFKNSGMEYFNTFGGNPVSCAIALAVFNVIEKNGLQQHALQVGNYMLMGGKRLMEQFEIIGNVRGQGLFIGFDLVRSRSTREPASEEAKFIVQKMMEDHKILLSTDGPYNNVIKMKPPMCFSIQNCDMVLEKLKLLLKQIPSLHFSPSPRWKALMASKNAAKYPLVKAQL